MPYAPHATVRPRQLSGPHCAQTGSDSAAGLRPGIATLEGAPLIFTHASPDARVLAGVQGPGETLCRHLAPIADQFRVSDLRECRAAVPYREEQLRVLVTADRLVAPIHTSLLLTECAARRTGIFLRLLSVHKKRVRTPPQLSACN